jgi:hypothetical protein
MKKLLFFIFSVLTITLTLLLLNTNNAYAACENSYYGLPGSCQGNGTCSGDRVCKKNLRCVERDDNGDCVAREWGCRCRADSGGGSTSTPTPTETLAPPPPQQPKIGPIPSPTPVPCTDVRYPEFHSLRPYQASPCNQEATELALFCGNDLLIYDSLTTVKQHIGTWFGDEVYWTPVYRYEGQIEIPSPFPCELSADGTHEYCWFHIPREKHFVVDLEEAYLPIMGNTEMVVNSVRDDLADESINDPAKVNEYVSWYLNGVNERAEYSHLDVQDRQIVIPFGIINFIFNISSEDAKKLVNFSGPLKKLLSFTSQQTLRIDEIDDAYVSRYNETPDPDLQYEPLNDVENPPDPNVPDRGGRHDQIVACIYGLELPIPFLPDPVFGGIPTPCYPGTPVTMELRLTDWHPDANQSLLDRILNIFLTFLPTRWQSQIRDLLGKRQKIPPIPDDIDYRNTHSVTEYFTELREWRGQECILVTVPSFVPLIAGKGFYICFENPLPSAPNFWSNQFTYIPFSSTEDRKGLVELGVPFAQPISPTLYLTNVFLSDYVPADLFFAHMQESAELADILQSTYVPQELPKLTFEEPGVIPPDWCDLREIRNNPGDNLFATQIEATVNYTAHFQCTFLIPGDGRICEQLLGGSCEDPPSGQECTIYDPSDCDPGQWCIESCSSLPSGWPCDTLPFGGSYRCVPDEWDCNQTRSGGAVQYCPSGYQCGQACDPEPEKIDPYPVDEECTVELYVRINTITKTPKADEVWNRLVAGPTAVFKRFFPKIELGAPVQGIMDIPAASPVDYSSSDGVVVAGNPDSNRPGSEAEIYFPHIGGIHQYFLQCIQTMLRPQGFGEECPQGHTYDPDDSGVGQPKQPPGVACGEIEQPPSLPPYPTGGYGCFPTSSGWCSVGTLSSIINGQMGLGWSQDQIYTAASICNRESGGWTGVVNDGCLCGRSCDFSIGLFQINALPGRCPDAFTERGIDWDCNFDTGEWWCTPTSEGALNECMEFWADPTNNILKMIALSQNGTTWCDWGAAKACGYCP